MTSAPNWQRPFAWIAASILVIVGLMALLNMGPETVLVAALGALIGTTIWCVASLSNTQRLITPTPRAVALARTVGTDSRVRALRTNILFGRALDGHSDRLHETLLELIDDQLLHAHGIDRALDPNAAAVIIGPHLTAFVGDPTAAASIADTKKLNRIVTLIEQI